MPVAALHRPPVAVGAGRRSARHQARFALRASSLEASSAAVTVTVNGSAAAGAAVESKEKVLAFMTREAFDGAVVMRFVGAGQKTHDPGVYIPTYTGFWDYYSVAAPMMRDPGYIRMDRLLQMETQVFATKGDKPEWFERPSNVIGANVCRVSGKLPNGGCDHVEVVNRDGGVEIRSMIYTEYFVKGTQPTDFCPLHEGRSFMDAIAGVFGKQSGPPPVPVAAAGLPPSAPASSSGSPAADSPAAGDAKTSAPAEESQPQKKRGFWSRVFGVGKDKSEEDRKKEEERRKQDQKKKEEEERKRK